MSYSLSTLDLSPARYAVRVRVQQESTLVGLPIEPDFVLYCETWSDVKNRLSFNLCKEATVIYNRKPADWFASACKHVCYTRRVPYYVAKVPLINGCYAVYSVIALKEA